MPFRELKKGGPVMQTFDLTNAAPCDDSEDSMGDNSANLQPLGEYDKEVLNSFNA